MCLFVKSMVSCWFLLAARNNILARERIFQIISFSLSLSLSEFPSNMRNELSVSAEPLTKVGVGCKACKNTVKLAPSQGRGSAISGKKQPKDSLKVLPGMTQWSLCFAKALINMFVTEGKQPKVHKQGFHSLSWDADFYTKLTKMSSRLGPIDICYPTKPC